MVFVDFSPLKYINFRRLYLSQVISMLGAQMTMVTIPFQIYSVTKSTFQTGLVSGIELICLLVTALWGGAIADAFDRRKIIIQAEMIMMSMLIIMAINAYFYSSLWLIYIAAGILSGVNGFHRPAFEAITPQVIPKSELSKVSSLISFKFVSSSLIGPTLAGYLVATVGPAATYLIDALLLVCSLLFLLRIRGVNFVTKKDKLKPNSLLKEICSGARYIYGRKDVLASYLVDFFAMVFCMPQVLFPALAEHYGMNRWLGSLYMSIAFGGLIATLLSGWTSRIKKLGIAISVAACGWSFAIFCTGIFASFWLLFIGFFMAGAFDSYSGIFRMTLWNESIEENYRGRVASFSMLGYTSGPLLGNTIMGFLGDLVGLHQSLAIGGSISLMVIVILVFSLSEFRKYTSFA